MLAPCLPSHSNPTRALDTRITIRCTSCRLRVPHAVAFMPTCHCNLRLSWVLVRCLPCMPVRLIDEEGAIPLSNSHSYAKRRLPLHRLEPVSQGALRQAEAVERRLDRARPFPSLLVLQKEASCRMLNECILLISAML